MSTLLLEQALEKETIPSGSIARLEIESAASTLPDLEVDSGGFEIGESCVERWAGLGEGETTPPGVFYGSVAKAQALSRRRGRTQRGINAEIYSDPYSVHPTRVGGNRLLIGIPFPTLTYQ